MIRNFSQDIPAVGSGLTPVDADVALPPAGADARRLETGIGFLNRLDEPVVQVVPVTGLEAGLFFGVGNPIGQAG